MLGRSKFQGNNKIQEQVCKEREKLKVITLKIQDNEPNEITGIIIS